MSIIIKANELNTLIYKYFLESGLSHSAYCLFNEAVLANPLQEFRFDVKPGHLLSMLEKGLVYAKIEAHVNMSEYMECGEPFQLLKPHTCKLSQKIRKERSEVLNKLEESLNDGIRRTNSVYNTAIANREFEDIVYDPKGGKYFQKFAKIKLPANESESQGPSLKLKLSGTPSHTLLYNAQDFQLDLLKYNTLSEQIRVERIFPSVREGQLAQSLDQQITEQHLIQLFDGNHVTFYSLKNEQTVPIEFSLPSSVQMRTIQANANIGQLVCFKNEESYCIVNLNTYKVVRKGEGRFFWRGWDQYLLINDGQLALYDLGTDQPKQIYESSVQMMQIQVNWQEIQFNASKTLFAAISYSPFIMHIYTFDNGTPLFVFTFQTKLLQALFVVSNSVDYFCWLTNESIVVFDISLNAYSKMIDVRDYDSEVRQLCILSKQEKEEMYLLCLGGSNLLIYDISNAKIERVELEGRGTELKQLGNGVVAMLTEGSVYFLVGQYIEPLFK